MRLLIALLLAASLLAGCSLPRIIVLNDPLDAGGHNDLGVSYQHRGEYDLAIREYNRAAELAAEWARPLINRGNVQAARGDWWQAEKSYRLALRREPGNAEAMNNLAWVLLQADETAGALEWAQKAAAEDPQEAAYLDTLAEIQTVRGDYPAARTTLERALRLAPRSELRQGLEQRRALLDSLGDHP